MVAMILCDMLAVECISSGIGHWAEASAFPDYFYQHYTMFWGSVFMAETLDERGGNLGVAKILGQKM